MHRIIRLLTVAAAALGILSMTAAPAEAKTKRIKFASLAPAGSTWMNMLDEWNQAVQERTGGSVAFKFYEGGVAGDELDVVRKMRINQQHGAAFTGVGLGAFYQDIRILDAPLLFRDYDEKDYVLDKLTPYIEQKFEENGVVFLGWGEVGKIYIYSNTPIRAQSDMNKLKVWGWDADPLSKAYMEQAGVTPIPLPIPDVLTSLQTGLIDTVYASPLAMIALQWFTKVKYQTDEPFTIAIGGNLMSKRIWKRLDPGERTALRETSKEMSKKTIEAIRRDNRQSAQTLAENGISTVASTPEGFKEMRAVSIKTREALVGDLYSQEIFDKVNGYLAE